MRVHHETEETFHDHDEKTESLLDTLSEGFDKGEWELLNQITFAQLVIFNRRRGGEAQRMLVSSYSSRTQNKDCPQEITEALSATEKNPSQHHVKSGNQG